MDEDYMTSVVEIPNPTDEELAWFRRVEQKVNSVLDWIDKPIDLKDELSTLICTLPDILEDGMPNWGWVMNFHNRDGVNRLEIESPVSGNIDALLHLLQAFLARFRPNKYLMVEWAYTSVPARPGGFGGGAAFVTARCLHVDDTSVFLEDAENQHHEQWISQPAANKLMS